MYKTAHTKVSILFKKFMYKIRKKIFNKKFVITGLLRLAKKLLTTEGKTSDHLSVQTI